MYLVQSFTIYRVINTYTGVVEAECTLEQTANEIKEALEKIADERKEDKIEVPVYVNMIKG